MLADNYQGKRFVELNDVTVDGAGRIYFTDNPGKAVYRFDPDAKLTQILSAPAIDNANGLTIAPDDKTFYLIEANTGANGTRRITAFDLSAGGMPSNPRVFHNFYPGRSGDGMTIDSEGNLWVAAGLNNLRNNTETLDTKAGIHEFAPDGRLLQHIPVPIDLLTNVAFGGPDLKTLYITAGGPSTRCRRKRWEHGADLVVDCGLRETETLTEGEIHEAVTLDQMDVLRAGRDCAGRADWAQAGSGSGARRRPAGGANDQRRAYADAA